MLETGRRPEEGYRAQVANVDLEQHYLFNPSFSGEETEGKAQQIN
jgi:hypothetical protein